MSKTTKLRNIHPGEVLREEFLIPLGVTQSHLAKEIGVTEAYLSAICSGKQAITADMALRLAAFFGTSCSFWLGLQADYDTEDAAKKLSGVISEDSESFLAAVAGTLSEDFSTEITDDDLGVDVPRHEWG